MNDFENLVASIGALNTSGQWVAIMHPRLLPALLDDLETIIQRCRHWYWRVWYWLRCRWTVKDTNELHAILGRFGRE